MRNEGQRLKHKTEHKLYSQKNFLSRAPQILNGRILFLLWFLETGLEVEKEHWPQYLNKPICPVFRNNLLIWRVCWTVMTHPIQLAQSHRLLTQFWLESPLTNKESCPEQTETVQLVLQAPLLLKPTYTQTRKPQSGKEKFLSGC